VLNGPAAASLSRRDRILIPSCIVLITLIAWAYLIRLDRQMTADMQQMVAAMGMMNMPWTATDAVLNFAMWAVMMVGMMLPSASPMLMLFAATQARSGNRRVSAATLSFGSGYLTVWTCFSLGATLAQWGLHQAALLSPAMASSSILLNGVILLAAGAWQLTPWKGMCLVHCRGPLGFFMTHWRAGRFGAFRMGFSHGAYCLGCCWALMCVLFVVGVMNLIWVAALTAFVLVEKIGPAGAFVARFTGVAMIALGIVILAAR
jgi:predicted metal-binding membrane protein